MILRMLPEPKSITLGRGEVELADDLMILLHADVKQSVVDAAMLLAEEIGDVTGYAHPVSKTLSLHQAEDVILLVCGPEQAADLGIEPNPPGIPEDHPHREAIAPQAYTVSAEQGRVICYAEAMVGLFYAVQTLRQLVRSYGTEWPNVLIEDWPTLPQRGLMLDVSRRKVHTLGTLKEIVAELSLFKLNVLQLYTEHTFYWPSHPFISAGSEPYDAQDMMDLDAACRAHHVELMPNLQSFGHAYNTLLKPEYQHLAETELLWTLSPAHEETYELLDDLYADMLPCFSSKTLNINCDETYDLGKGASKAMADEMGVGRVYLNHILRVRELAARYGCRIQMWGDILLHHPELIDEVPDDITLLDWHYDPQETYPSTKVFGESGRRFWVCPGTGSWNAIFPRLNGAKVNIRNLIRDGVEAGAEGVLNTDWGDAGHYQALGLSYHGYIYGAVQSWTGGTTDPEEFDEVFIDVFLGPAGEYIMAEMEALAELNELPDIYRRNRSRVALAFFDEPLVGETVAGEEALSEETVRRMIEVGSEAVSSLELLAPGHPRETLLYEMLAAGRMTRFAGLKTLVGQQVRRALADPDVDPMVLQELALALRRLDSEVSRIREEFELIWRFRARRSEIDVALSYFARLRVRLGAAVEWLEEQKKALARGERVDAALETYSAKGFWTVWQKWPR